MRKILVAVLATLSAATLAACGGASSGSGGSKEIRLYADGDVNVQSLWQNTLIPAFEKADPGYTVKLTFDLHGQNSTTQLAKLGSAVKTGHDFGFDLIDSGITTTAASSGLLAKPDADTSAVPPQLLAPVNGMALPYRGTSVALAYDSAHVTSPPKTLDDLLAWIKANPGEFTYNSPNSGGSGQSFVTTVLDKYVPADARTKLATSYDKADEKYWAQGLSALKDLGPSVYQHTYPNGNQGVLDLLGKGTIWMAPVWVDQALTAKAKGTLPATVKVTQISDPSFTGQGAYLGVPKNDTRTAAVSKLLNFLLTPQAQASIVDAMNGFPAIDLSKLPAGEQAKFDGMSNNDFRQPYQSNVNNDLNQQWQAQVA
ncbi:extracellular solute-binding protein [Amycolatopsis alkalitolerans]|uniref:Extracellular solute-binding protein n=1 Tax=Amycolatopsis alkalitolerans TaxID=2547244 RepID=A0A5C4M4X2_9PSEU|nr:extracellular solute-binding protein [Amycolatopsis alkalitolerans]TNC28158.1 extracellular solute-binding protein [Amycolatopsis alkalitolerans]